MHFSEASNATVNCLHYICSTGIKSLESYSLTVLSLDAWTESTTTTTTNNRDHRKRDYSDEDTVQYGKVVIYRNNQADHLTIYYRLSIWFLKPHKVNDKAGNDHARCHKVRIRNISSLNNPHGRLTQSQPTTNIHQYPLDTPQSLSLIH